MPEGVVVDTPLGLFEIVCSDELLVAARFVETPTKDMCHHESLQYYAQQVRDYFDRRATDLAFRTPLEGGSSFTDLVRGAIGRIPFGETCTYGELARRIGSPGAARAVGQICASNPLLLFVPCHRVVGARGDLVGYAGGIERKKALLAFERDEAQYSLF